jgi:hypothetical protein
MIHSFIRIPLEQQIERLIPLVQSLQSASDMFEKLDILNSLPIVQDYLKEPGPILTFLNGLTPECDFAIKSIIAIGQAPIVLNMTGVRESQFEKLRILLQQLLDVERFYQEIGGIIGYHLTILQMILTKNQAIKIDRSHVKYIHPEGLHLDKKGTEVKEAIKWGLKCLPQIAEIYPIGGAGDRLNLIDPQTQKPLPAAMLPFLGRTLLEGLIRDLQSREYLYFKIYGKQVITPIAMMTSWEKDNHQHILTICQQHQWFQRSADSFFFFIQPLVPVITIEGNWSLSEPLHLTLKPGGHGVIWKLAEEQGAFAWLLSQGRLKSLVRQINNPLAGTDHALIALTGLGCKGHKALGFISCERMINSAEGVNVIIETTHPDGFTYCLTNIEYTEFKEKGIDEVPSKPGDSYSIYPTNTNILFIDIPIIRTVLKKCPIPGPLINLKSQVSYIDSQGKQSHLIGGRLESTMQNIADVLVDKFPLQLNKKALKNALKNFIVYNYRRKTISTTKQLYQKGQSPFSTPDQALYDILLNNLDLFHHECRIQVPSLTCLEEYLQRGPNCLVLYHPALGPLYSVIRQKIKRGRLGCNSELILEIAELDMQDLDLDGSLWIEALSPLGQKDSRGTLQYGNESRCLLHRITVHNRGIDRQASNIYWKNEITRHELVKIILHEGAEFYAQDVHLEGSHLFEVPANHVFTLKQDSQGQLIQELRPILSSTWSWNYTFDVHDNIVLKKVSS